MESYNIDKITVLMRTSNRPIGFKRMLDSIRSQQYTNWELIVSVDDDISEEYVKSEGVKYIRVNRALKESPDHNPYNLYFNDLIDAVDNSWIYCVDDDDVLENDRVFDTIIENATNPDKIYVFRINDVATKIKIPSDKVFGTGIKLNQISTQNYVVHSKHASKSLWAARRGSDFIYIKRLSEILGVASIEYIDECIYRIDQRNNLGNRADITENLENTKHALVLLTKTVSTKETQIWCEYYFRLGFDHIRIYDNESPASLSLLAKHPKIEVIKIKGFPDQNKLYAQACNDFSGKYDWVAFFDDDELIQLRYPYNTIKRFTSMYGTGTNGISVCMFDMGYSELTENRSRHFAVDCLYIQDTNEEKLVKTIVRPETVSHYPTPHAPAYKDGTNSRMPNGYEVAHRNPRTTQTNFEFVRLYHYVHKSYSEYEYKTNRGRGSKRGHRKLMNRHEYREFTKKKFKHRHTEFAGYFRNVMERGNK